VRVLYIERAGVDVARIPGWAVAQPAIRPWNPKRQEGFMKKVHFKLLFAGALLFFTVLKISAPAISHPNCPPGYVWTCAGARCSCVQSL